MAKKTALKKAHATRMKKLAGLQGEITKLSATLDATKGSLNLARAKAAVVTRLSKCMKEGKLTPAEFKKLDIKKLSTLPKEAMDIALGAIEAMEPKVTPGQRGSADAMPFSEVGKNLEKRQHKSLKAEAKKDLIKMGAKIKLSKEDEDHGKDHEMAGGNHEEVEQLAEGEYGMHPDMKEHMAHMAKCLEEGKIDEAKEVHAKMAKCMEGHKEMALSDVKSEDAEAEAKDLETKVDELTTNMARLAGLVNELMSVEKEEGHDLEGEEGEEQELEAGDDKEDKE